jgi:type IV pilus assembly protein PilA
MLTILRNRLHREEEGFTLIELMVVVLIIAILMAIAIPTFLGAQNKAKDRSAQSDLRNGITDVRTVATDNSGVLQDSTVLPDVATWVTKLAASEPNITFAASDGSAEKGTVDVNLEGTSDDATLTLYTKSASGKYFGETTDGTGKITTCEGDAVADVSSNAACTGTTTVTTEAP